MKIRNCLKKVYHKVHTYLEFMREAQYFCKYYTYASNNQGNLDYKLLMLAHSIEKGLCVQENIRPFGSKKIDEIIEVLNIYSAKGYEPTFAFNLTLSILEKYCEFYQNHGFVNEKSYQIVFNTLEKFSGYERIACGAENYIFENPNCDYYKLLSSRHSIRHFSSKAVSLEEIQKAINCAILSPSACNRQMVKAYCIFNHQSDKIEVIHRYAQGLSGFDRENINYFVITYNENSLLFPGEKNQGMFNAGLFSTNLINAMHNQGIGSCFIQFANSLSEENKMKEEIGIPSNERVAVLIAFGKYDGNYIVPKSARKEVKDILKVM